MQVNFFNNILFLGKNGIVQKINYQFYGKNGNYQKNKL